MRNLIMLCFTVVFIACGGGSAGVDSGPMPQGGSFEGVWFSPQYGRMDLRQEGQNIIGMFEMDERTGHIQGVARGRVMRFQWTEEREMLSGFPRKTTGRGYFVYIIDTDGEHKLQGEWGHDSEETGGGPWNAVKSQTLRPRQSLEPTSTETSTAGAEAASSATTPSPEQEKPSASEPKTEPKKGSKKASSPKKEPAKPAAPAKSPENTDDLSDL